MSNYVLNRAIIRSLDIDSLTEQVLSAEGLDARKDVVKEAVAANATTLYQKEPGFEDTRGETQEDIWLNSDREYDVKQGIERFVQNATRVGLFQAGESLREFPTGDYNPETDIVYLPDFLILYGHLLDRQSSSKYMGKSDQLAKAKQDLKIVQQLLGTPGHSEPNKEVRDALARIYDANPLAVIRNTSMIQNMFKFSGDVNQAYVAAEAATLIAIQKQRYGNDDGSEVVYRHSPVPEDKISGWRTAVDSLRASIVAKEKRNFVTPIYRTSAGRTFIEDLKGDQGFITDFNTLKPSRYGLMQAIDASRLGNPVPIRQITGYFPLPECRY